MILLRVNISEENGTLQVQKRSDADGATTAHERALLRRILPAVEREVAAYCEAAGSGPVTRRVHRALEPELDGMAGGPS